MMKQVRWMERTNPSDSRLKFVELNRLCLQRSVVMPVTTVGVEAVGFQ